MDLDRRSSGCARLGGGVGPPLLLYPIVFTFVLVALKGWKPVLAPPFQRNDLEPELIQFHMAQKLRGEVGARVWDTRVWSETREEVAKEYCKSHTLRAICFSLSRYRRNRLPAKVGPRVVPRSHLRLSPNMHPAPASLFPAVPLASRPVRWSWRPHSRRRRRLRSPR